MKSVCVYLGSRNGFSPQWIDLAWKLGQGIAQRGWRLIYGGGRVGMMGRCADGALSLNGEVIGVIPHTLVDREMAHEGLTELFKVDDMHMRKSKMSALADGFITMPGGIGTLEEFFETWTWSYLGLHQKPFGLLNFDHFYDDLLKFTHHSVALGFLEQATYQRLIIEESIDPLLDRLAQHFAVTDQSILHP